MSVLSTDLSEHIGEPLRKHYEAEVKKTVGGMCPRTFENHIHAIQITPGIKVETLKEMINRVIEDEMKYYHNLWHGYLHRECNVLIHWSRSLHREGESFVLIKVNDEVWSAVRIHGAFMRSKPRFQYYAGENYPDLGDEPPSV